MDEASQAIPAFKIPINVDAHALPPGCEYLSVHWQHFLVAFSNGDSVMIAGLPASQVNGHDPYRLNLEGISGSGKVTAVAWSPTTNNKHPTLAVAMGSSVTIFSIQQNPTGILALKHGTKDDVLSSTKWVQLVWHPTCPKTLAALAPRKVTVYNTLKFIGMMEIPVDETSKLNRMGWAADGSKELVVAAGHALRVMRWSDASDGWEDPVDREHLVCEGAPVRAMSLVDHAVVVTVDMLVSVDRSLLDAPSLASWNNEDSNLNQSAEDGPIDLRNKLGTGSKAGGATVPSMLMLSDGASTPPPPASPARILLLSFSPSDEGVSQLSSARPRSPKLKGSTLAKYSQDLPGMPFPDLLAATDSIVAVGSSHVAGAPVRTFLLHRRAEHPLGLIALHSMNINSPALNARIRGLSMDVYQGDHHMLALVALPSVAEPKQPSIFSAQQDRPMRLEICVHKLTVSLQYQKGIYKKSRSNQDFFSGGHITRLDIVRLKSAAGSIADVSRSESSQSFDPDKDPKLAGDGKKTKKALSDVQVSTLKSELSSPIKEEGPESLSRRASVELNQWYEVPTTTNKRRPVKGAEKGHSKESASMVKRLTAEGLARLESAHQAMMHTAPAAPWAGGGPATASGVGSADSSHHYTERDALSDTPGLMNNVTEDQVAPPFQHSASGASPPAAAGSESMQGSVMRATTQPNVNAHAAPEGADRKVNFSRLRFESKGMDGVDAVRSGSPLGRSSSVPNPFEIPKHGSPAVADPGLKILQDAVERLTAGVDVHMERISRVLEDHDDRLMSLEAAMFRMVNRAASDPAAPKNARRNSLSSVYLSESGSAHENEMGSGN